MGNRDEKVAAERDRSVAPADPVQVVSPADDVAVASKAHLGGAALTPAVMLALQRTVGNRATRQMISSAGARPRASVGRRVLARQHVQLVSGRYVGDLEGAEANVREDVLRVMENLHRIWSIRTDEFGPEHAAVDALPPNQRLTAAQIPRTIAALRRNEEPSLHNAPAQALLGITLTAPVGRGQPNAKGDILALLDALHANWNIVTSAYGVERQAVIAGPDPVNEGTIPQTIQGIRRFKEAFVGGTSRRGGVLGGTNPQTTPQQVADREAALITPGTQTTDVVVGGVTQRVRQGFQDVVRVNGRDVSYHQDLWETIDALITGWFRDWGPMLTRPRIQWNQIERISDTAKNQVDAIFGTYAQFGRNFRHTGPNPNLLDASARPGISADSLMTYLLNNQAEVGDVRARHNAVHSPGRPEMNIVNTFRTKYLAFGNNRARMETVDRAWPALNTGGAQGIVSVQPYDGATPQATRRVRWAMFQTMIHEYFHTLNHANYYRYADQLGGDDRSVLVEGGASLMTDLAWQQIGPRIRTDAALREAIEGQPAAYDASVIPDIDEAHYHPQIDQVRRIISAFGAAGPANFRAAFLTGRMELIGYERTAPGSAAAAQGGQTYIVPPTGVRTLADVAYETQTPVEQLATLNSLAANATVRPGQRLVTRGAP